MSGDSVDFGEPLEYDPEFRGPVHRRSCTDLFCLFIFIAFIIGWAIVAGFAIRFGNPEQVIYPSDSYGRICGRYELSDKPFLYFFNIMKCAKFNAIKSGCNTTQVCVAQCPNYTVSFVPYRNPDIFSLLSLETKRDIRDKLICDYDVNVPAIKLNDDTIPNLLRSKRCGLVYFKSEPLVGRCVPVQLKFGRGINGFLKDEQGNNMTGEDGEPIKAAIAREAGKGFSRLLNVQDIVDNVIEDLGKTWKYVLGSLLIAMIVSFVWIVLLQVIAGFMVWFSMVAILILSTLGVIACVRQYMYLSTLTAEDLDEDLNQDVDIDFTDIIRVNLHSLITNKKTWMVFAIICAIFTFLLTVTFIFLRERVNIAIALIKEASKALDHAKSALFLPLLPYLFQSLVILFGGFVAIMIAASQKPVYRIHGGSELKNLGLICNPFTYNATDGSTCEKYQYFATYMLNYAHLYNIFMTFWVIFFIGGMFRLILAGGFAAYYWAFNKPDDIPDFPVATSTYRAFRYHMGSIAFGSLILAIFRLIRLAIEYVDQKCKEYADNQFFRAIIWTCRCCFWLFESFLKFLSTNAYIMMSIHGKGFLPSAHDAFFLLLRNVVRVAVLDKVADYLLFIGKVVVTAFMGLLSFYYFNKGLPYELERLGIFEAPDLNYSWAPVVAICIGTYIIAGSFFAVYDMAVDTIFLCFLEDCERNDGSSSKPYYMSQELMEILDYKNTPTSDF